MLNLTHGCWWGSESTFHRWRSKLAEAAAFPPLAAMEGYSDGPGHPWEPFAADPLTVLLNHPDNGGAIEAKDCAALADRLETLLPKLPEGSEERAAPSSRWLVPSPTPHIGNWRDKTRAFIEGLRRAATAGEDVRFQ
jgi:hypothetical protein